MISERVGLTLGKFAPLHRGHQQLIETALSETERLIVLIDDHLEPTTPYWVSRQTS
jgi:HTH-type transcriptional regulator, transcriptional repressor of NAD biosynthesis genes